MCHLQVLYLASAFYEAVFIPVVKTLTNAQLIWELSAFAFAARGPSEELSSDQTIPRKKKKVPFNRTPDFAKELLNRSQKKLKCLASDRLCLVKCQNLSHKLAISRISSKSSYHLLSFREHSRHFVSFPVNFCHD